MLIAGLTDLTQHPHHGDRFGAILDLLALRYVVHPHPRLLFPVLVHAPCYLHSLAWPHPLGMECFACASGVERPAGERAGR